MRLLNQAPAARVQSDSETRDAETHYTMNPTATDTMSLTTTGTALKERDEDHALVARYLDGDMAAFEELMSRHERQVFGLCLRFVKNRDDALDLTQEVFIKAFESLGAFRGQARFRTWVYRIAINHCINHVRKHSRHFVEVEESTVSVAPAAEGRILEEQRRALARELVEVLPPKQKAILQLRMNENLSYEEIAGILGRSVSTVKSSIFFALEKLRKMVEERRQQGQRI